MPRYHYDTPKLSPRVKACRYEQNEYGNSTAAAAHQVCESTTAYRMETTIMEVEEVESRSASVIHRNGQNMSVDYTSCSRHALRYGSVLRVRGCWLPSPA